MRIIVYLILISLLFSCKKAIETIPKNQAKKILIKETPIDNLVGYYVTNNNECDFSILIGKTNNSYNYTFYYAHKEQAKGKVNFIKEEEQTLLKFKNSFTAVYSTDTISFQNYGNAMNDFEYIPYCSLKYVTLIKTHKIFLKKEK